uniref:Uncharacterized protein n=1 Tax=Rhipicephalus zambeziensis TaxID=60191 RepID=A0A224YIC6_9ACAR
MVSTLALCFAVALLIVGARAAPTDESSAPTQRPGGFGAILEEMERPCFQEAQMTAEEITTMKDILTRPRDDVVSQNGTRQLGSLEQIDLYAPTPEIAQGIRSKWDAFFLCLSHQVSNL